MEDAQVDGNVDLEGATVDGGAHDPKHPQPDSAIFAPGVKIGGDLRLCNNFEATGQINIQGALIGRNLNCSEGRFSGVSVDAKGKPKIEWL